MDVYFGISILLGIIAIILGIIGFCIEYSEFKGRYGTARNARNAKRFSILVVCGLTMPLAMPVMLVGGTIYVVVKGKKALQEVWSEG